MASVPVVDVHAHFLPEDLLTASRGFRIERDRTWGRVLWYGERLLGPVPERLTSLDAVLADMDGRRIDVRALATTSWLTFYWAEPSLGRELTRASNEHIARCIRRHPARLVGLATLPLQDVEGAVDELRHAVLTLGLRGAVAGTSVNGVYLDDPTFEPLFEELQHLDVPVFFHPDDVAGADRMTDYYLTRLIGNPHEIALALARLILGGVVERFPQVRMCFPMAGGSMPFLLGRIDNGWRVRKETSRLSTRPPLDALRSCYFDTIVHSPRTLLFALELVPATNFMLGSDYPWDMGEPDPVAAVEGLELLASDDRARILGGNAAELLRLQ